MKLVPNRFDVRVREKFKDILGNTPKDIDTYVGQLDPESETDFTYVTTTDLHISEGEKKQLSNGGPLSSSIR